MIIVVMNAGDNNENGNWEMVYGRPPDFPFPAPKLSGDRLKIILFRAQLNGSERARISDAEARWQA